MGEVFRRLGAAVAGALALAAGIAGSSPVLAACDPAAANDVTATCSGVTDNQNAPNGYGTGVENNVTVNVLSGATVTGTDHGIFVNSITSLTNSGSITSTAPFTSTGVSASTIGTLVNSGSISGSNRGIFTSGIIGTLINSGSISGDFIGISAGTFMSLTNSGSITGGTFGIDSGAGTLTSLTNSGSITGGSTGISAIGEEISSLTNSGSITGGNFGINAERIINLTNSGLIAGGGVLNHAIREIGFGDTQLTLLAGSVLIGQVDLGGGLNTLNVGKGLSMATTFVGAAPVIGSMNLPYVVLGNQVVTADTTSLANHSTMVADLTGGIFSTVENRLDNLRGGVPSFAQPMALAYDEPVATRSGPFAGFGSGSASVDRSRQVWMQAFGSFRQQEGNSRTLDSQQRLGGFVSGMDIGSGHNRAGIFFGGSVAASQVDANAGRTTSDSFFGGAYASTQTNGTFVDLAFTAGYSSFDRERRVANNFVPGGIETAKADHHGWFVSPEVRFMRPVAFGAQPLEASLTLRYAGLFLDGFNESGVTAGALNVGSQDIHLGIARAALSLPFTKDYSDGAQARWIFTAGIEGSTQFGGDKFSGTLQGQNVAFSAGARDTVGLFGSYRAELASPLGHTLYALAEGIVEQDGSWQVSGKAGFRVRY